ncbi:MAG: hypothetical protein QW112_01525, partial [Candidatus Micrarchaeia archaeon]
FNTVCELGKMYKIESLRPLVEKKLRKIAENKEIDIYARQRAKLILNPITLPETRKDVKTEHTLEQGNCET